MRYAVLLYVDAGIESEPGGPEWDASMPHHGAFNQAAQVVSGAALHGTNKATTLRVRGGERLLTDGPFAETKEQLWGLYVIEADDLDAAVEQCSLLWEAEHGTIEIRPVIPMGG